MAVANVSLAPPSCPFSCDLLPFYICLHVFSLFVFTSPVSSLAWTSSLSLSFPPIFPWLLLSLPHHVSPLSFLFYALSDVSQDSSGEDSEEEEDFSRVQFGSRYTAARCEACSCVACSVTLPLHVPVEPGGLTLTAHTHTHNVVWWLKKKKM